MRVKRAQFVLSAVERSDLVTDGRPQIAFVGRSNVGKSSLLNRLVGRKALARISSSPGKTRAVNYFLLDESYYFVDLPGFGYAKAARSERRAWAALMEQYFRSMGPQPRVIQLVDAKVGATTLDVQAIHYLRREVGTPTVVATKIDRLPVGKRAQRLAEIAAALALSEDRPPIPCSARTGEGVKDIWREIQAYLHDIAAGTN